MDKKAVSPMIATVLLIFFAIALGAVIMNWGANYAVIQEDANQKTEEAQLKCDRFVSVSTITGSSCVQSTHKMLKTTLRNDGQLTVDGIRMILIGEKNFETQFFDMDNIYLASGQSMPLERTYDYSRLGNLQVLEIIPKIDSGAGLVECKMKVELQNVPECE